MIWALLILGLYPYLIYPGVVFLISMLCHRPVIKRDVTPSVTIIISAFNEAEYIVETVKNKLSQHYPAGQLKVIVVSDGSDDGTDELVMRLAEGDKRLTFVRQEPRQGKTMALNTAMAMCKSEIAVISDANSKRLGPTR